MRRARLLFVCWCLCFEAGSGCFLRLAWSVLERCAWGGTSGVRISARPCSRTLEYVAWSKVAPVSSVGGSSSKPCSTLATEGAEVEFGATEMSAERPGTPGVENAEGAGAPTRRRIVVMGRFAPLAEESARRAARGPDAFDAKGGGSRVSGATDTFWGDVIESVAGGFTVSGLEAPVAPANCSAMSCSVLKTSAVGGSRVGVERLGRTGVGGVGGSRLKILKRSRTTRCDSSRRSSKLTGGGRVYRATAG